MIESMYSSVDAATPAERVSRLCNVLKTFSSSLRCYSTFVTGFDESVAELKRWQHESKIKTFLEEQRLSGGTDLKLEQLLIQPVQRICRYPLLMGELIKHTPGSHADYALLNETLHAMEGVVKRANEEKRRAVTNRKIKELSETTEGLSDVIMMLPTRYFVHDGSLKLSLDASSSVVSETVKCYLFHDVFFWCRVTKAPLQKYEGHIFLDAVSEYQREGDRARLSGRERTIFLSGKSGEQLDHWSQLIEETIAARKQVWLRVYEARYGNLEKEKQALTDRVSQLEGTVAVLGQLVTQLCKAQGIEVPAAVAALAPPPLVMTPAKPVQKHSAPALNRDLVGSKRSLPYVAMALDDRMLVPGSSNANDLSFAMGELLLIVDDLGFWLLGRPLEETQFPPKQIPANLVSPVVRRGSGFLRLDQSGFLGGSSPQVSVKEPSGLSDKKKFAFLDRSSNRKSSSSGTIGKKGSSLALVNASSTAESPRGSGGHVVDSNSSTDDVVISSPILTSPNALSGRGTNRRRAMSTTPAPRVQTLFDQQGVPSPVTSPSPSPHLLQPASLPSSPQPEPDATPTVDDVYDL